MSKNNKTSKERAHMDAVASLGCIACAKLGFYDSPAELHHIKNQTGMGKRSSHFEVIPLCPVHHRGQYGYHTSPAEFTGTFGSQVQLLQEVLDWLGVDGCPCGCTEKKGQGKSPNPFDRSNIFYEWLQLLMLQRITIIKQVVCEVVYHTKTHVHSTALNANALRLFLEAVA